jgi:hypothetical protein
MDKVNWRAVIVESRNLGFLVRLCSSRNKDYSRGIRTQPELAEPLT